jgi:hypothetical protein
LQGKARVEVSKTLEKMLSSVDDTRNAAVAFALRGQPELGSTLISGVQR